MVKILENSSQVDCHSTTVGWNNKTRFNMFQRGNYKENCFRKFGDNGKNVDIASRQNSCSKQRVA